MTFKSGEEWNGNASGRPKGSSDRLVALQIIMDEFVSGKENFRQAIKEFNEESPLGFFHAFVQPFLPKEYKIDLNATHDIRSKAQVHLRIKDIKKQLKDK